MIASTFTHASSTFRPQAFISVIFACYCCLVVGLLIPNGPGRLLTLAQTIRTSTTIRGEQYPASTTISNFTPSSLLTTTAVKSLVNNSANNSQQHQQPKSLKFTLISGKIWKFNIKANSFTSHREGELRLHKNVSVNNYIIDDDGWFQYNPQQQQLLAWPSLATKAGTYHFVLLPSGIDFEADSENIVNLEVAANIVVELIRPLYQGVTNDIDQFIDYKFSLDYLHRHTLYPLLLNQIVSVFDTLSRTSLSSSNNSTTTSSRSNLKLNEYLLISSTYSSDGEYFSLTWSTHPSLTNNTITPISDCRLSNINDFVAKLSNLSFGKIKDEKFVIYYPISAPIVNSQAIVPTERGNYALKLSLHGPCHTTRIINELSIVSDLDDKDNNIVDLQTSLAPRVISTTYPAPGLPKPEAIDSNTATQATTTKTPQPLTSPQTTTLSPATTTASISPPPQTKLVITTTTTFPSILPSVTTEDSQPTLNTTTKTEPKSIVVAVTEAVNKTTVLQEQVLKSEGPLVSQQQPKMQPQAKSFANYLDSNDMLPSNLNMSTTVMSDIPNNLTTIMSMVANSTFAANEVSTKDSNSTSESTLNEDFIGILNDVMEYLVSVAIPIAIIIGSILLISIMIALCSLCIKRRKSKQFEVRNRFNFRYGSERRAFLKNSSKPVILDADQKSLSMGGTPQHRSSKNTPRHEQYNESNKQAATYLPMTQLSSSE